MAITKNTYSNSQSIQPSYWRIKKDVSTESSIIIEEVIGLSSPPQNQSTHEQEVSWVKVTGDGSFEILTSTPSTGTAFSPPHSDLDYSQILIKAGETFVLKHSGTPFTDNNRSAVTGYQMADTDILYLKIDHNNNNVTVYP